MTYLRNISRFAVLFIALAVVTATAVPAGWIALRFEPPSGEEQKGHWIIVKEPAAGLAAWWSDAELARIVANDPDYVKRIETEWNPEAHPIADAAEAQRLAVELAQYWNGDVPQANFWAHGALTRRGDTPRAFRWAEDGLTQRTELEDAGMRPRTAVSPIDPDPVDARWDNALDIVEAGDRWGSHLLTPTLDHVNRAERQKLQVEHHPNSPPSGEIDRATKATVSGCRMAGLEAEKSVFENYVRAWGGLGAQDVSYDLPENCVLAMAPQPPVTPPSPPQPPVTPPLPPQPPVTPPSPPQPPVTPPQPPQRPVTPPPPLQPPPQPPQPPVTPPSPPQRPVTPPSPPQPPPQPPQPPVTPPSTPNPGCTIAWLCGPDPDPDPVTTNPGNPNPGGGGGGGGGGGNPEPETFEACDSSMHSTQAAADAVICAPEPTIQYFDCAGYPHNTQAAADAVSCATSYTACDGSTHNTQAEADAVDCSQQFQEQILHDLTCQGTVDQTTGQCDDLTYTP